MPSTHVCSNAGLPILPHLSNQEPPRAQQVIFPTSLATHLAHTDAETGAALAVEHSLKFKEGCAFPCSVICQVDCLHSRELTFAGMCPVRPRVFEIRVARVAALLKPSTAAKATTDVALLVSAALGTNRVGWRRHDRRRRYSRQMINEKTQRGFERQAAHNHTNQPLHSTSAGHDALNPCMLKIRIARITTLLEPSASGSATADFTDLIRGALRTRDRGGRS